MKVIPYRHRGRADPGAQGVRRRTRLLLRKLQPAGFQCGRRPGHQLSSRTTTRDPPAACCAACTDSMHRMRKASSCASRKAACSTWRWTCATDSPTYGQWVGVELSGTNHRQLWIPAGSGAWVSGDQRQRRLSSTRPQPFIAPRLSSRSAGTTPRWPSPGRLNGITPALSAKDAAALPFGC